MEKKQINQEDNCLNCTKRYPACQDTCPNKSKGKFYKRPDTEYISYISQLFYKQRRKH